MASTRHRTPSDVLRSWGRKMAVA
eukprot:COSAG02_NODE_62972_length_264_cov_0.933333_1_plen_23_part_01